MKTLFFVVLLTWRTVFEDDLVVRCGNHDRLFAVGFAVHCAGAQHITAFFAVERVHIVGFIQIDGHLDLFAFDGGRSVCGQALFVEAVGYFDFFTLLADVADGFFFATVGLLVPAAAAMPLRASAEDRITVVRSFIFIPLDDGESFARCGQLIF